ncbi:mannose-6-phosphate isomerase [Candidatus Nomurabacteria bacterium RIFCSPLOWO2_01_FULL_40_18]|uniref:Mannose-6-phosphate isomerase n=1 Tax=Candidatus Nomurabacteria bacterium RIFCSPLOWO2_01_FULL_40_18 TaxID=1801773 RepID=A0A1F6XIE1_9BACT|nr:MAG: mannose-6-phosphate isomerase [Candidatus Nomurabacteria bacterium RIFCSPLOWO2_01_FULL_40_18]
MVKSKIFQTNKPWGNFRQFTHNEMTTVKVLSVNPNTSLSLQYHNHREEFWKVLSGHPILSVGEKTIKANPGDEFEIPKKELHRIETKNDAVQILEISYGNFDEEDIVRIKDQYGRA